MASRDPERERLALLVTEAMRLRWYVSHRVESNVESAWQRDRAHEALPAIEARMFRRQTNLRNLDTLIELDAEGPEDIQREARRSDHALQAH